MQEVCEKNTCILEIFANFLQNLCRMSHNRNKIRSFTQNSFHIQYFTIYKYKKI